MDLKDIDQAHVLDMLVLEVESASPEHATALWDRLSRLCTGDLALALARVLSRYSSTEEAIVLGRLEIDAGRVRESHLEEDLIEAACRALAEILARKLQASRVAGEQTSSREGQTGPVERTLEADGAVRLSPEERRRQGLRFLLLHGRLPWWYPRTEPQELEALLEAVARDAESEARRLLVATGQKASVRRRLALQLGEPQLHRVVRVVERSNAPFIIAYVQEFEQAQARATFVQATTGEFRVAVWEFVLVYLLVEYSSRFNDTMFVHSTIAAMARRYNVAYVQLLAELRQVAHSAGFPQSGRRLRGVLDTLWPEVAETGRPAARELLENTSVQAPDGMSRHEQRREGLRFALLHGRVPWWYPETEPRELESLLDSVAGNEESEMRRILVETGQRALVRRRLAFQLKEPGLHGVVRIVEPSNAPFVIAYVEELEHERARANFVQTTTDDFRVATWEFVLAYLLVEHRSRLNAKLFERSTIVAMAQRYSVSYIEFLVYLRQAVGAGSFPRSRITLQTVLEALWHDASQTGELSAHEILAGAAGQTNESRGGPREFKQRRREGLRFLLLHGRLPGWYQQDQPQELERLLQRVRADEKAEARRLLVETGQKAVARRRLVVQLDELGLHDVVRLVEPANASFIISYVQELQQDQERATFVYATAGDFRAAIWEFVLVSMFVERGSHFNRRMFVRSTMVAMAQRYSVSYIELLAHLRQAARTARFPASGAPLRTVIEELWQDDAQTGEISTSLASAEVRPGYPSAGGSALIETSLVFLDAVFAKNLSNWKAERLGGRFEQVLRFDNAFRIAARAPTRLRLLLLSYWGRPRLLRRLAKQPKSVLEELVRVMMPSHAADVQSYTRQLQYAHVLRPIFGSDAQTFGQIIWHIVLQELAPRRGSSPSWRTFIRATLKRLAAYHAITYHRLVAWLWRALRVSPHAGEAVVRRLASHIGALHHENLRQKTQLPSPAPLAWSPRLADAQSDVVHALSGVDTAPGLARLARALLDMTGVPPRTAIARVDLDVLLVRALHVSPARVASLLQRLRLPEETVQRIVQTWSLETSMRLIGALAYPMRTLTLAIVDFVEAMAEAGGRERIALPNELAQEVRRAALLFLLTRHGRRFAPDALLEFLLRRVADRFDLSWPSVLSLAVRHRHPRAGSAGEVVRGFALDLAKSASPAIALPALSAGPPVGVRHALVRLLLTGRVGLAHGRSAGRGQAASESELERHVSSWLKRMEQREPAYVLRRIASLLKIEHHRNHALQVLDNSDMLRVFAWQYPQYEDVVADAMSALEEFSRSPRLTDTDRMKLRQTFWRFVWQHWAGDVRGRGHLWRLFGLYLTRREPRWLSFFALLPAGSRLFAALRTESDPRADESTVVESRTDLQEPTELPSPGFAFTTRIAGLVLLWPMMTRYFERQGLFYEGQFCDVPSQERAVLHLFYLATGLHSSREPDLLFCKFLCGLDLNWPVPLTLEIDEEMRSISEGLLTAVVQNWAAVGSMSIQGLRGSFLCREGRVTSGGERWNLEVEPKTFDILLDSWPWPLSVVKLPWMALPLFVQWRK